MRCLWLAGEVIRDPSTGLGVYSSGVAAALGSQPGVDLVAVGIGATPTDPLGERGWQSIRWVGVTGKLASSVGSIPTRLPHMAHVVGTSQYRATLGDLLRKGNWDVVLLDHLRSGWAIEEIDAIDPQLPVVYVSQNLETQVRRELILQTKYPHSRLLRQFESAKVTRLERAVLDRSSLVTAITAQDALGFRSLVRETPVLELPPGYSGTVVESRVIDSTTPRRVAILGNLLWSVKRSNLTDLLDVADPIFSEHNIEAMVIGPVDQAFAEKYQKRYRSIVVTGRVADVGEILANVRLGLVSQPRGGGFKLRILDYVYNRVPLAILAGSCAGIPLDPGDDYLEASTEQQLAEQVVACIDDFGRLNRFHAAALTKCTGIFDWAQRGSHLRDAILQVID
jgi:polysaccharide biosynthesis protein PslH